MAKLPGIIIKIGAETRDAIQGINRVDRALGRVSSRRGKAVAAAKGIGTGLLAVGGAAAAAAVAIGVEGVQAAVSQEKANAKLRRSLKNLGLEDQTDAVLENVDALQKQTGVSEDELLPSFEQLVRVTGDTDMAFRLLRAALDTATGAGKPLETVTAAIAKAAGPQGMTGALSRLVPELDKTAIKGGDAESIMRALNKKFGGQAQANADTMAGTMDRLGIHLGEINEQAGTGILEGFMESVGGTTGDDALKNLERMEGDAYRLGRGLGMLGASAITAGANLFTGLEALPTVWDDWINTLSGGVTNARDWMGNIPFAGGNPFALTDEQAAAMRRAQEQQAARNQAALAAIVNPPRPPAEPGRDWGAAYSGVTSYSPMRYRTNAASAATRSRSRAAVTDARSNARP